MPKPLSLKKNSQKPITQFFKSNNGLGSQKTANNNHTNSESACIVNHTQKRKDRSPSSEKHNKNEGPNQLQETGYTHYKKSKTDEGSSKENDTKCFYPSKEKSPISLVTEKIIPLSPVKKMNNSNSSTQGTEVENFLLSSPAKMKTGFSQDAKSCITPKKNVNSDSPVICRSPKIAMKTPVKSVSSPSVTPAKVALDLNDLDDFSDDWNCADLEEPCLETLDLTSLQRCEVTAVTARGDHTELRLKTDCGKTGSCLLKGVWRATPLAPGETVSVAAARDNGRHTIDNSRGLLVQRSDHLLSSTAVVAGVFCRRKAVLQERFRGIDCANEAMTLGTMIHELVQKALVSGTTDVSALRRAAADIVSGSPAALYAADTCPRRALDTMQQYIAPLAEFVRTYVKGEAKPAPGAWAARVDRVLDIEQNVCCPELGLKGKLDATLLVTLSEKTGTRQCVLPLEVKSGRASRSAEHRGQLVLYGMMLDAAGAGAGAAAAAAGAAAAAAGAAAAGEGATVAGALLYLKDKVDVVEVRGGRAERRDLVMLRNELARHLAPGPADPDPEQLTDIEDLALLRQSLPEPIHHETACAKCAYLTVCSLHLWSSSEHEVSPAHPLSRLRDSAVGHLSPEHTEYFHRWHGLVRMEERAQAGPPQRALWTVPPETRRGRGTCVCNMRLKHVRPSGERLLHVFEPTDDVDPKTASAPLGPQAGDYCVVSAQRPCVAAGTVALAAPAQTHVLLDRDLSALLPRDTLFHLDTHESAAPPSALAALAALAEPTPRADRLRRLIIDRAPPEFEPRLPREAGRLGARLMRSLNVQQQRAVFRAVAAKDYALLEGLPGTGKTQTVSVLIQMLVALRQRVLVTAHTHSAVDTVLTRLPSSMRVLRLGSAARVLPALAARCEAALTADCDTPEKLDSLYQSMVLQCIVLRPLLAASRFVLVGDPDQLPPVVRSRAARRLGMEESLFHRLSSPLATSTLSLQYRMNGALAALANDVAYAGRLVCATDAVRDARLAVDEKKLQLVLAASPWLEGVCGPAAAAAVFCDVAPAATVPRGRCTNVAEACVAMCLIDAFIKCGVKPTDIGVIAPYREQVALLRRAAARLRRAVDCSTVDQFQGRDKPLVLYSCTRCVDGDEVVKEGEVLNDQRRLAVSVTRAKHKFIALGHARALRKYPSVRRMLDACTKVDLPQTEQERIVEKYLSMVS